VHIIVDAVFDRVKQQFGTFPCGINQLSLLMPNVECCINKYSTDQQSDCSEYYASCQTLEHRRLLQVLQNYMAVLQDKTAAPAKPQTRIVPQPVAVKAIFH
jgi:hypothetical protein